MAEFGQHCEPLRLKVPKVESKKFKVKSEIAMSDFTAIFWISFSRFLENSLLFKVLAYL